jgi:hypothetical protein
MKFYVSYIGYVRYGVEEPAGVKTYTADSTKEALIEIINYHGYPLDQEDVEEDYSTVEKLLKFLESQNGDGCDYVLSIISDNGTLIFASEIYK